MRDYNVNELKAVTLLGFLLQKGKKTKNCFQQVFAPELFKLLAETLRLHLLGVIIYYE